MNQRQENLYLNQKLHCTCDVLYHYTSVRSRGVPMPMQLQRTLAVPTALRKDVLLSYHDGPGGSHFGFDKTYSSIKAKYYWPNMYTNVEKHVKSCDPCQKESRAYNKRKAPLVQFSVKAPCSSMHMDILGHLTPSSLPHAPLVEYKYILLVVDSFSGWCAGFPLVSQDAKTVAFFLYSEIFCRYSTPECNISDQGSKFMSQLVHARCELFQVAGHRTSAYKPNCNGRVEVMNIILAKSLRAYCNGNQEKWALFLPGILLGLRMSVNSTINESPFRGVFGRQMRTPLYCTLLPKKCLGKPVQEYLLDIQNAKKLSEEVTHANTTNKKVKQKQYYDKCTEEPPLKVGQKVLLDVHKTEVGESRKLGNKFKAPFLIVRLGPNYTYYLSDDKVLEDPYPSNRMKEYFIDTIRTTRGYQKVRALML